MNAFNFFFAAAAGISLGIAVIVLPALWLYQRFAGRVSTGRRG
ncbi:hypothetical protein CEB3_c17580 [Peptococcaceae bacterium CEB3]|nr:hypothetical protein CEB3_c17580 [Peptococcaceae bacterium CEB3]